MRIAELEGSKASRVSRRRELRQPEVELRRAEVLSAAADELVERGFDGAPVRGIPAVSGPRVAGESP